MNARMLIVFVALLFGCAEMGSMGGPSYGETSAPSADQTSRDGTITALDVVQVDEDYKLGIGTVIGAVAGGLIGSQVGQGRGSTAAAVAGAAAGAAAGPYAQSKMKQKDAQRNTVQMRDGGQVHVVQPVDSRLRNGMSVVVAGSGENARVMPR